MYSNKQMTREEKVLVFDTLMGNKVNVPEDTKWILMKLELLKEETKELEDELLYQFVNKERGKEYDYTNVLKELADVQYVLSGLVIALGMDKNFDAAFNRVHESNLSKLVDGKPLRRSDGKVLKGPNYKPPSMKGLV